MNARALLVPVLVLVFLCALSATLHAAEPVYCEQNGPGVWSCIIAGTTPDIATPSPTL